MFFYFFNFKISMQPRSILIRMGVWVEISENQNL